MRIVLSAGVLPLLLAACNPSPAPVPAAETPATVETAATPPPPPEYGPATGLADDKPALEIVSEELQGGVVKGGYHPSALKNENPTWGSHGAQGDADTGMAKVTFAVPAGARRIGIPVVTGPTQTALTLQVLDADGKPIDSFAPTQEYLTWKLWEVPLSASAMSKVVIEAFDTSSEWGQWIAFGQPRVME